MNYYDYFTSYCIPSKTSDSLKFHIFLKMQFYFTRPPPRVQLNLEKSVGLQISGSYASTPRGSMHTYTAKNFI